MAVRARRKPCTEETHRQRSDFASPARIGQRGIRNVEQSLPCAVSRFTRAGHLASPSELPALTDLVRRTIEIV
jgi:hypothetical protein